MDWTRGFKAAYHACIIDRTTWEDAERFEIESGSINRTDSGLRQSADIDCVDYEYGSDRWVRIYMDVTQDGASEHIPLFTGITSAPEEQIRGGYTQTPVQCYSVLRPAQTERLDVGYFAAKGYIGSEIVEELLSVCPSPIEVESGSPRLTSYIVAEDNETALSMADKILTAINWRLRIDGDGTIHIMPKSSESVARFSALEGDVIETEVDRRNDWFDCPNVFRARTEDASVVVTDDDEDSILSTVSRGYRVWAEETSVTLSDSESLLGYAQRRLKELQSTATECGYPRVFDPAVMPSDIITLHYPRWGLVGDYQVSDQRISLDASGTTDEEVIEA